MRNGLGDELVQTGSQAGMRNQNKEMPDYRAQTWIKEKSKATDGEVKKESH